MSKAQGKFDFSVHHPFKTCIKSRVQIITETHHNNQLQHASNEIFLFETLLMHSKSTYAFCIDRSDL